MADRLKGKVALVTGAGSVGPGWGNGRATAVLFAREGAAVLLADRNRDAAEETARIIEEEGGRYAVVECHVTDEASVSAAVESCRAEFGRLDILHNNVGGSLPGGPTEISLEQFRWQIDINLTSVFLTCKAALPIMEAQGGGAIVNVGSVGGMRHLGHHHIGYTAGKGGLVQFSRHVAVQYGPKGIRCNTVILGLMDTPLLEHRVSKMAGRADLATLKEEGKIRVPLRRRGDGWDAAYAALFLASDEAKYVTATEILVDGGLVARAP